MNIIKKETNLVDFTIWNKKNQKQSIFFQTKGKKTSKYYILYNKSSMEHKIRKHDSKGMIMASVTFGLQ